MLYRASARWCERLCGTDRRQVCARRRPSGPGQLTDTVYNALCGLAKLFHRPLRRMSPGGHRVPPRRRSGARPARMEDRADPLPGGGCTRAGRRSETALRPPRQATLVLEATDHSGPTSSRLRSDWSSFFTSLRGFFIQRLVPQSWRLLSSQAASRTWDFPPSVSQRPRGSARASPHAAAGNPPPAAQQMSALMMSSLRPDLDQPGS